MTAERCRRRFRPTLWPTILAIPALGILIGLGSWQLARLQWKEALIAERSARLAAPPIAASEVTGPADAYDLRRVLIAGEWLHAHEILIEAQIHRGAAGYHVVTPFRLGDGRIAIVDRGFVPLERKASATRLAAQAAGQVAMEGVLRKGGKPSPWTPDNDRARNTWYFVDPGAIAARIGVERLFPFVVEVGPAPNPGGFPIGGRTVSAIRNDHLGYGLTWFGLAVVLVAIYIVYHLHRAD